MSKVPCHDRPLTEHDRWWWVHEMAAAAVAYLELTANAAGASAARQWRLSRRLDAALDAARLVVGLEPLPPRTRPPRPHRPRRVRSPPPVLFTTPARPTSRPGDDLPTLTPAEWDEVARLLAGFDPSSETSETAGDPPFDAGD